MKNILKIISAIFMLFILASSAFYLRNDASFYFMDSQIKEGMDFDSNKEIWEKNPNIYILQNFVNSSNERIVVLTQSNSRMTEGFITLVFVNNKLNKKDFSNHLERQR
jgi:hypothetical protein